MFVIIIVYSCVLFRLDINRIRGVMVSVLASSAVDRGFESRSGQTKTIQLVFVGSPLSIKEKEQRLIGSESE